MMQVMWNEEAAWPRDVRMSFINFEGDVFRLC